MTSIGETLRRERERRNLDLDQVSHETKIPVRFLDAIERENFDQLPAGVFAKSFARQYARMLGLDEDEIGDQVQRALEATGQLHSASGTPGAMKPSPMEEFTVPKVEAWERVRDPQSFSWSAPLPALGLVVLAMLGCSLVYSWSQRPRHTVSAAALPATHAQEPVQAPSNEPPQTAAEPAPATPPVDSSNAVPDPSVPPPAANTAAVSTSEPPVAGVEGAVKVAVTTAAEPVWVSARTDGKYSFSGTLEANETRTVEAATTVVLRVGNAGGVSVTLNGKPIGEIGPKGQVRTVQLTSGGFQIVAPKPSLPGDPLL